MTSQLHACDTYTRAARAHAPPLSSPWSCARCPCSPPRWRRGWRNPWRAEGTRWPGGVRRCSRCQRRKENRGWTEAVTRRGGGGGGGSGASGLFSNAIGEQCGPNTVQLAHINCCILLAVIRWLSALVFPSANVLGGHSIRDWLTAAAAAGARGGSARVLRTGTHAHITRRDSEVNPDVVIAAGIRREKTNENIGHFLRVSLTFIKSLCLRICAIHAWNTSPSDHAVAVVYK